MPDIDLRQPCPDGTPDTLTFDVHDGSVRRPPRRRWAVAVVVMVIAGLTIGSATVLARRLQPSVQTPALVGRQAPAFLLDNLDAASSPLSLASFAGLPVVINFWASWCVPCRTEMPALEAAHLALADQVAFIGIDHQDDHRSAVEFIDFTGVTYESGFDPEGSVAAAYGLYGLPTTVLISSDGIVVAEVTGAVTEDRLLALVHEHLGITID